MTALPRAVLRVAVGGRDHTIELQPQTGELAAAGPDGPDRYFTVLGGPLHRPSGGPALPVAAGRDVDLVVESGEAARLVVLQFRDQQLLRSTRLPAAGRSPLGVDPAADRVELALAAPVGAAVPDAVSVGVTDRGPVEPLRRTLLLIGAMKSGTTTLWRYLTQHPAIHGNEMSKEPHVFSSAENHARGPLAYALDFPPAARRRGEWALDASTHYAKHPTYAGVPERIAQFPGEFRFLYVMRHPVDRIESHVAHGLAMGHMAAAPDVAAMDHLIATSSYASQLDRYHDVLGDPAFLLLDFGQLVREPLAVVDRVRRFLDLPPHPFEPIGATNQRRDERGADRYRLDDQQRQQLAERLRPDVQRLVDHYGFEPARAWTL